MSRQVLRQQRRAVNQALDGAASEAGQLLARDAALALLDRSINFGHARLAVLRLSMAVHVGAPVHESHWRHCGEAALRSRDPSLQALWQESVRCAHGQAQPPLTLASH